MITIFKQEFDFDIYDVDDRKKFDTEYPKVMKAKDGDLTNPDGMRKFCEAVFVFFDALFGGGARKKLFGEKTNIYVCLEAVAEFMEQMAKSGEKLDALTSRMEKAAASAQKK